MSPTSITAGDSVTIDGDYSQIWNIDFGDGTGTVQFIHDFQEPGGAPSQSYINHTYTSEGTYEITASAVITGGRGRSQGTWIDVATITVASSYSASQSPAPVTPAPTETTPEEPATSEPPVQQKPLKVTRRVCAKDHSLLYDSSCSASKCGASENVEFDVGEVPTQYCRQDIVRPSTKTKVADGTKEVARAGGFGLPALVMKPLTPDRPAKIWGGAVVGSVLTICAYGLLTVTVAPLVGISAPVWLPLTIVGAAGAAAGAVTGMFV